MVPNSRWRGLLTNDYHIVYRWNSDYKVCRYTNNNSSGSKNDKGENMNILVLGNGFDLYHKLPTRYDNFLHTIDFLIKYFEPEMKTIADVFGDSRLQKEDAFICKCYNTHKTVYENITLDEYAIKQLINLSKDNLWFRYLLKIFDNKVGWIDFENEIAYVLDAFKAFLKKATVKVRFHEVNKEQTYIIKNFNFFLKDYNSNIVGGPSHSVIDDFTREYPLGSGVIIVNKEKIIEHLLEELNIVAKTLRLYLGCFVDSTLLQIKNCSLSKCPALSSTDKVINFNYTDSYERFYSNSEVFHLHGTINKKIIIGVNSDDSDKIDSVDVSFLKFKKYFQRTQYSTDLDYVKWLTQSSDPLDNELSLLIMGHSLDSTDKDILIEIFNKATEVIILYHDKISKNQYITNLVKLFGKEGLEKLRRDKNLTFLYVYMDDFGDLINKRANTSSNSFLERFTF